MEKITYEMIYRVLGVTGKRPCNGIKKVNELLEAGIPESKLHIRWGTWRYVGNTGRDLISQEFPRAHFHLLAWGRKQGEDKILVIDAEENNETR